MTDAQPQSRETISFLEYLQRSKQISTAPDTNLLVDSVLSPVEENQLGFDQVLSEVSELLPREFYATKPFTVMISYPWLPDTEQNARVQNLLLRLAKDLKAIGFRVLLDILADGSDKKKEGEGEGRDYQDGGPMIHGDVDSAMKNAVMKADAFILPLGLAIPGQLLHPRHNANYRKELWYLLSHRISVDSNVPIFPLYFRSTPSSDTQEPSTSSSSPHPPSLRFLNPFPSTPSAVSCAPTEEPHDTVVCTLDVQKFYWYSLGHGTILDYYQMLLGDDKRADGLIVSLSTFAKKLPQAWQCKLSDFLTEKRGFLTRLHYNQLKRLFLRVLPGHSAMEAAETRGIDLFKPVIEIIDFPGSEHSQTQFDSTNAAIDTAKIPLTCEYWPLYLSDITRDEITDSWRHICGRAVNSKFLHPLPFDQLHPLFQKLTETFPQLAVFVKNQPPHRQVSFFKSKVTLDVFTKATGTVATRLTTSLLEAMAFCLFYRGVRSFSYHRYELNVFNSMGFEEVNLSFDDISKFAFCQFQKAGLCASLEGSLSREVTDVTRVDLCGACLHFVVTKSEGEACDEHKDQRSVADCSRCGHVCLDCLHLCKQKPRTHKITLATDKIQICFQKVF